VVVVAGFPACIVRTEAASRWRAKREISRLAAETYRGPVAAHELN
jgi:hypothetical protein